MDLAQVIDMIYQHEGLPNSCDHSSHKGWSSEKPTLWDKFIDKGQIDIYPKHYNSKVDYYWDENSRIALSDYPYHSCKLFECPRCQRLFFTYLEFGGHAPEKRFRLVNPKLLDHKNL